MVIPPSRGAHEGLWVPLLVEGRPPVVANGGRMALEIAVQVSEGLPLMFPFGIFSISSNRITAVDLLFSHHID